jgi:hypothetical protein
MDRGGNHLFSRPGFSLNQNHCVGWSNQPDLAEYIPNSGAAANDIAQVARHFGVVERAAFELPPMTSQRRGKLLTNGPSNAILRPSSSFSNTNTCKDLKISGKVSSALALGERVSS